MVGFIGLYQVGFYKSTRVVFLVGPNYINPEDNYGRLIDFLSQISNLSYFNMLGLADFMMYPYAYEAGSRPPPPGLKNFRANSVFRASAIVAQKSWVIKKYFNAVKNSKATVFQDMRKCLNILNDKKYIFNTVKIPGQLCF